MEYVDLIVHLDDSRQSSRRLDVAVEVARRHESHLTGMWVSERPVEIALFSAGPGPVSEVAELEAETVAKQRFTERIQHEDIAGEWRAAAGNPGELMALHARHADLAIIGQPDWKHDRVEQRILVDTLMTSGRPVLVVPYAGEFGAVGNNVMVAWNGSRVAARAVNDAIPLLRHAATVRIVTVNPGSAGDGSTIVPATDLALHLARHGVDAEASELVMPDVPVADALLNRAFDLGADLLVTGCYGHSRLREWVLGGTTRDLLDRMTIPVLMSH